MNVAMMTIEHDCYKEVAIPGKIISVSETGGYWRILYEPATIAGTFNVNASFNTMPATWRRPADDLG